VAAKDGDRRGEKPVFENLEVSAYSFPLCRATEERTIRIHSIDLGAGETIRRFDELEDFNNPGSLFTTPASRAFRRAFSKRRWTA
jgi:hypothetical protein